MRFLFYLLILVIGQYAPTGPHPPVSGGGGSSPTYTGQSCHGGLGANITNVPCNTTMTVSTGDEIVAGGNVGDQARTLTSCSSLSGSATVTWTVPLNNVPEPSNNEALAICVGNVTGGGTVQPQMNWNTAGADGGIVAAAYSGSTSHATDGSTGFTNFPGVTTPNGNLSGVITTTTNNDLLVGVVADTAGQSSTITAGTTSVTYTKRVCTGTSPGDWGGQTCLEDGAQTTAAAGTGANWTFSAIEVNVAAIVAVKP